MSLFGLHESCKIGIGQVVGTVADHRKVWGTSKLLSINAYMFTWLKKVKALSCNCHAWYFTNLDLFKLHYSIPVTSPLAKQCANCKHTIDSHRPETGVDNYIRYTIASKGSHQCRVTVDSKDKGSSGIQSCNIVVGETDDDKVLPWFEPVNVDPDELGKLVRSM